jgi:hypothetical protein
MDGSLRIAANTYIVNLHVAKLDLLLVAEQVHEGKKLFICNCGFGYDDMLIAYACDDYCKTHGMPSEEILKKVVYNPRIDQSNRNVTAR